MDDLAKKNLRSYALFLGIVLFMAGILAIFSVFSHETWKSSFVSDVQTVLDKKWQGRFLVRDFFEIDGTLSTSSAFYALSDSKSDSKKACAAIVRIPSLSGPVPAVFVIFEGDEKASFAGYALDLGNAETVLDERISKGILSYWEKLLPRVVISQTDFFSEKSATKGEKND